MSTVKIEWKDEEYIVEGTYYPKRKASYFAPEEPPRFSIHKILNKDYRELPDVFYTEHNPFWWAVEQLCLEAYHEKELYEAEERAILNYEFNL